MCYITWWRFTKIYISLFLLKGDWIFCKWERRTETERQRQTAILTHNFFSWPYHLCLFCFLARGHLVPSGQSPWLTICRPKTPNWRLNPARLLIIAVGHVYIISQCPYILVVNHMTCFHLFTQVHPANIVYTAETSGSVKGQYATHGHPSVGRPAKTYIHQLCVDTGCSLEDLPGAMDDTYRWWEQLQELCAISMTWWWRSLIQHKTK